MLYCPDHFRLDDPNAGEFKKGDIATYLDGLKQTVAGLRDDATTHPLMEMSDVVIKEDGDASSVWAWWVVPGTPIAGSALIKVTDEGVTSERLSYYTPLS